MNNPYYFTDRALRGGFNITLESHHISQANSKLNIKTNYPEFGIEARYFNKVIKDLSVYLRAINQYNLEYQIVISSNFDKQDEDSQVLDEAELFINSIINHNLTESDLDKIDVRSPLENQIQHQEMKDSEWSFDKINSMTIYFYKTGEIIDPNYVKIPLRSNAVLNIEKNDKCCFVWSILASVHPCNNNHPIRVTNYKQFFIELTLNGFDFTHGFKCIDVHKFNELNNLSIKIFELNFYQAQNKWRHKLVRIEVSKNEIDRVIDIYNI